MAKVAIVEGVLGAQASWGRVFTVTSTPDDRYAISGGLDKILRKHDLASGVEVCTQQNAHSRNVLQAICAPNGEFFVSRGGKEKFFKVWKTENLELIQQVEGHDVNVMCVAISSTSTTIASGDVDGFVKIWEKVSGGSWECK